MDSATAKDSSYRIGNYKNRGFNADEGRKKRLEESIQLRKYKREEQVKI